MILDMNVVSGEFVAAKPVFKAVSPGPAALFTGRTAKIVKFTLGSGKKIWKWSRKEATASDIVAEVITDAIKKPFIKPVANRVTKAHQHARRMDKRDIWRKNGIGGRNWICDPGRHKMVIVFHDANRAGPHVDVHIGRLSLIYRVKPDVYAQLRYNRDGYLTESSRKLLMDFVRAEIANGSRLAQNLDHSMTNARAQWTFGNIEGTNYGDGFTRQIISETEIEVYKAHENGPIEFYAPALNPYRGMYLYRLYPGTQTRAPICVWGNKNPQVPTFTDRLHLKMEAPEVLETLDEGSLRLDVDWDTSTAKYDGSSCYVVIGSKGTTVWSPRTSSRTGEQIEYTFMMDGLARATSDETIVAMGEILFREKGWFGIRGPYLPCAVGGGLLNAHAVLPKNVEPEIRLYRVDRMGKADVANTSFWLNRELQQQVASLDPHLKVVDLMDPATAAAQGFEGIVVVPHGMSVNEGVKIKWWRDADDWRIDSVEFKPGDKGGLAGVVWCTSLESNKRFKLGPGQVGNHELCNEMMMHPEQYEGSVIKVQSRHGHEGRAAKMLEFHQDKGRAPELELIA